jgi:hypothetical protein
VLLVNHARFGYTTFAQKLEEHKIFDRVLTILEPKNFDEKQNEPFVCDYYDDYFSMDVQESSYIAAMNENGFEVLSIGTVFNENKIIDCSISVNINKEDSFDIYKERIEDFAINTCINYGLSENEMVQTIENLFNFDTYYNNIYNNKENYARFGSNLFTGVIFEGGKDFQFDGTSYFFVFSSIS